MQILPETQFHRQYHQQRDRQRVPLHEKYFMQELESDLLHFMHEMHDSICGTNTIENDGQICETFPPDRESTD